MIRPEKIRTTKVVDLVTGTIAEADLEELHNDDKSVTSVVWSTGCPVYDRVPWLLGNGRSRLVDWQDLVEPGSMIVLVKTVNPKCS